MGVNVSIASSQANKVRHYADSLLDVKRKLILLRDNFEISWRANEIVYINNTIDELSREILNLSTELDSIGSNIMSAANEIKREEATEEAAALKKKETQKNS